VGVGDFLYVFGLMIKGELKRGATPLFFFPLPLLKKGEHRGMGFSGGKGWGQTTKQGLNSPKMASPHSWRNGCYIYIRDLDTVFGVC
jgi:hypothetical protein